MHESEPGTTSWNFFNAETLFSNNYYGDSNQHDVKICHEQYVRASPFDTCYWNMNDDENFARSLSQEEWSQLSIAESPELTHFRPEYVESSYQNWRDYSNNYYAGQEGGLYETDDVGRLCSSPGERSRDENEHSYKFKVTDESELDGEVEKRLYQMYSVPHIPRINGEIPSVDEATSDHQRLLDRLELYDLIEHKTQGDGNCQFRALSDQFYRSPEHHKFVREQVVHQLKAHPEIYEAYVPMEYSDYLKTISKSGEWGDHVTLQAAADSYGVRILILTSFKDTCYIEILPKEQKSNRVIYLSFWAEVHYDSIYPQGEKTGLDIRYATISDGFPLDFDRNLHFFEWLEVLWRDSPACVDELIEKTINRDPSFNYFIVADIYAWPATIAKKFNLANVSFWTELALVFTLIYHLGLLKEHGHFPCKDDAEEDITCLPGVESINTRDIMPYLKESESEKMVCKALSEAFDEVKKADFVIQNTVQELEPETLSALNKIQPIYAIGPIKFFHNIKSSVINSLWSESDCTQWLNSKPPGSVLYVSFGSLVQTNRQIIEEIANGLLLSEVNFIWIARSGLVISDETNGLPNKFEDAIKDRGLIIPWCDQMMVLSNPAIGGFLTHCGWNSIQESIWCGVPMICYPITFDQPVNRKLVVDDWKLGINLCDETSLNRIQIADKIKNFMHGTSSDIKQEIKKFRAILRNAMEIGGSSNKGFDQFILDLKAKINALSSNS